ncbi:hypothetical protein C8R43DRAFT_1124244 [Mycena crocata]|nr:hypothetical protein C8R43DRAFT_1124244 [Mycena crocata]
MPFSPPWSELTLPLRATSLFLQDSFILAAAEELGLAALREPQSSLASALTAESATTSEEESSEDEDGENNPSPASRWSAAFFADFAPFLLGAVPRIVRPPLTDITPVPDIFTPAHLRSLGFKFVKWNDQSGAFLDMCERIGAFYIGVPEEALIWERGIIKASQAMESARWFLDTARLNKDGISYGIKYPERRFQRPENSSMYGMGNVMVLARLRYCKELQMITSFQNAAYRCIAPRLWQAAHETIEALLENDPTLHLPLDFTNFAEGQPTAFSEVEYMFSTNIGTPRMEEDYVPSLRAITTLGNYVDDRGLIIWREKVVVQMPVGATVLFPAGCMPYSFTAVDDTEWRMTVTQSFDHALHQFRANRFASEPPVVDLTEVEARSVIRTEAMAAMDLYSLLEEFDRSQRPAVDPDFARESRST